MIIVNSNDVTAAEDTPETNKLVAQGIIKRKLLIDDNMAKGMQNAALVSFTPGARLKFHTHDYEQVLYVTEGTGILATEQEEHVVGPGMVILIPPGEVHWHGATPDSSFTHVAVYKGKSQPVQ